MNDKNKESVKSFSGRWWEFYFVRYFIGTVIGSGIVFYLIFVNGMNLISGKSALDFFKELNGYAIFCLLALGLTYCYISSAPILVFHATRGIYIGRGWLSNCGLIGQLVLALLFGALICCWLENIFVAVLFAIVFVIQGNLVLKALSSKRGIVLGYYGDLTKARADSSLGSSEYVESYKHLREHANAFLIVIFEAALGVVLYFTDGLFASIVVLSVWIFPAAMIWLLGNVLENEYVNKKKPQHCRSMNL